MREIIAGELSKILEEHENWNRTHKKEGKCADLCDAYLRGADLEGSNLQGVNLEEAYIEGVNLEGAAFNIEKEIRD